MLEEPDQHRTALSWDVALQIERAAAEFEAAWRQGRPHEIAEVLRQNSVIPARELFCALAETELELRRLDGEMPDAGKWSERFPQWNREIEAIVRSIDSESSTEAKSSPILQAGTEFGRYRILKEIGRGAMGVVFQAQVIVGDVAPRLAFNVAAAPNVASSSTIQTFDARLTSMNASRGATSPAKLRLGEVVAIKIIRLPQSLSETEQRVLVRRFYNEASATAALDHPHVIPICDVGSVEGVPYFTMPFVAGGTLKDLKHETPLAPMRAAQIVAAAARALHHAHRSGLFHRDIKPSNILIDSDDRIFVTDFGVSLHRDELGQGPGFAGTPLYMSPEQAAGKSDLIDGRSDVFSLGIVLYELLAGANPFDSPGATATEIIERICHVPVPPLRQRSDVPQPLEDICLKALRRQPEDRYSTAGDFADELTQFIKLDNPPQSRAWTNRKAINIAVAFVIVMVVVVVGLQMRSKISTAPDRPRPVSRNEPSKSAIDAPKVIVDELDSNRITAEWALSLKSTFGTDSIGIQVRLLNSHIEQVIAPGQPLPDQPFQMIGLRAWHVPAISNAAFRRYIAPLHGLLYLQLDHNRDLTRETISSVDQLKQLKILGLTGTQITGKECAEILSKLPSLVLIGLSSEQFTDEVAALVRTSPNITMVWLHNAREHQIQQLFAAKQLTQILLWSTHFADSSVWHEAPKHGPNLITLGPFSTYLTDADLEAIAQLPKLRELWLQESTITDSGLLALQSCRTLRALNITKTPVTEISVRCLQTRLPQCRILWDGGVIEPGGVAESKQGAAQ